MEEEDVHLQNRLVPEVKILANNTETHIER